MKDAGWEDKILYWAWLGKEPSITDVPTKKRIEYVKIIGPGASLQKLACGVWNDDKYTPLNRGISWDEIGWHKNLGSVVENEG